MSYPRGPACEYLHGASRTCEACEPKPSPVRIVGAGHPEQPAELVRDWACDDVDGDDEPGR